MHAGRVRDVCAVGGGRFRAQGAHVKRSAHGLVRSTPLPKLAASPASSSSRSRARSCRPTGATRRLGGRHRWLPRPAWCSPKGVDRVRASPHHVAHIPAHPAPLRPWPPARAPRRAGARGRGAQQPLLGPWAGDVPRLGARLSRATSTSRCGVPSAAPHTRPPRRRAAPRTGGAGERAPPHHPHAPAATNSPAASAPTSAPSSYPFLRRSLPGRVGLGLAYSFGDEQAPATFVGARACSATPAPRQHTCSSAWPA